MKTKVLATAALALAFSSALPVAAQSVPAEGYPQMRIEQGFKVEKLTEGLTFATGMTWDNQGRLYVLEAGGAFLEEPAPSRIMRVDGKNRTTEIVNLDSKGLRDSVVGIAWHKGAFYVTHRDTDNTGAVSRVTLDGAVTKILTGVMDSASEHQLNDIRVGPDGRMYLASGPAGNSAVMGMDVGPFIEMKPDLHTSVCQDVVLTGQNYEGPDIRTKDNMDDKALTGAFVPFGTVTTPGQRIAGTRKCGGSILVFDPNNAEATIKPYAWGLRNTIGLTWNSAGEMYAAVNGYDVRGLRPVFDQYDATYKITEGTWYGWPDFSANLEPVNDPKFRSPDNLLAPVVVGGQPQGKKLDFVIDHAASGLRLADKSLIVGLHPGDSSPSMLDVAPASWGDYAGHLFIAEWGDLAPATNPLITTPVGYRIVHISPGGSKIVTPFLSNAGPGAASAQGAQGQALERPFDVKFGPDGAMYISDYGVSKVNVAKLRAMQPPYEFSPGTGAIWRVTRADMGGNVVGMPRTGEEQPFTLWLALLGAASLLAGASVLQARRKA